MCLASAYIQLLKQVGEKKKPTTYDIYISVCVFSTIAAGILLRTHRLEPSVLSLATQTASEQGWRRPLLAWLGVQAKLAEDRGNLDELAKIRRRMDLLVIQENKN